MDPVVEPWFYLPVVDEAPGAAAVGGEPASPGEWVLLTYHLPREPSTPRTALWRRLKQYGVAQMGDGLVALPADARTQEQLEWAAEGVVQAAGTAGVWRARPTAPGQERELAGQMAAARAQEYAALAAAARLAADEDELGRSRALQRLRRTWREITRRDFFPPAERDEAAAAMRGLSDVVAAAAPGRPTAGPAAAVTGPATRGGR